MPASDSRAGLFSALLKHWRGQRGMSQLDLALTAGVSSRHVSFLETGRSTPSAEMVVRLGTTLDVPLRHVNAMLEAAGHPPHFAEPPADGTLPESVQAALTLLKDHHEPYPLVVVDRAYGIVDLNQGARALLGAAVPALAGDLSPGLNLARMTFDPEGAKQVIVNFDEVGRTLLWRLQREVLADPNDAALRALLDELLAMPTVSEDWRDADLTVPASPTLQLHIHAGGLDLRFFLMVTVFQAPQAVLLDELRIETWFPSDPATADACAALAAM